MQYEYKAMTVLATSHSHSFVGSVTSLFYEVHMIGCVHDGNLFIYPPNRVGEYNAQVSSRDSGEGAPVVLAHRRLDRFALTLIFLFSKT